MQSHRGLVDTLGSTGFFIKSNNVLQTFIKDIEFSRTSELSIATSPLTTLRFFGVSIGSRSDVAFFFSFGMFASY